MSSESHLPIAEAANFMPKYLAGGESENGITIFLSGWGIKAKHVNSSIRAKDYCRGHS
jgi:hypothetical protein